MPVTDEQEARRAAILKAAIRLGKTKEIDRISARAIAGEAGVALRTLYRYYPSKHHVFAAVLTEQVQSLEPPARKPTDAGKAVADLMAEACQDMLRHKHLAHAMIISTQAVRAQSGPAGYHAMRDTILATAGIDNPNEEEIRIARLVEQVTFGVLTWTVGGELDSKQAIADIRLACRRLLAATPDV